MRQGRLELAEADFRKALAEDPNDPIAHASLGLCLSARKLHGPAEQEAKTAIGLMPDLPFSHYALARIYFDQDRNAEADRALEEAIQLNPEDPDFFALRSNIRLQNSDWKGALEAAEEGLRLDARHTVCANLRGMALVKLGRKKEAEAALHGVLAQDPENALSHANQGWTLLERNDPKRAMEHFREALRIDPELDWARAGMVEALKARNPIYRLMLQYFLWMAKLSDKLQIAFVLGLVVGRRVLQQVAKQYPEARPFVLPLIVLLLLFFYLTWVAQPLFNLTLRLNRFGWYALTSEQRKASLWVGLAYLAALVCGLGALACWWLDSAYVWTALIGVVVGLVIVIPISATFQMRSGGSRLFMAVVTILLALLGVGSFALQAAETAQGQADGLGTPALALGALFLVGSALSTWLGFLLPKAR